MGPSKRKRDSREEDDDDDNEERLYFGGEAEEGKESADEESDAEEVDPVGNPLTKKGKKTLKICRHFGYSLIAGAASMGWEDEEAAKLIDLVAKQLNFDETKLMRCLEKTGTGSPSTLAALIDSGDYKFSVPQMVSVVLNHAKNVDHFIQLMAESLEHDLFDLTSDETLDVLFSFTENNMNHRESQRYARQLCEHAPSKRICGKILLKFTAGMSPDAAASFAYDIVTLDFFQDVPGTMKECLRESTTFREQLDGLLTDSHRRDGEGEILDSDADSDGNLRDFIDDSGSERGGRRDDGSGSGSDDEGSGSDSGRDSGSGSSSDSGSGSESGDLSGEDEEEVAMKVHVKASQKGKLASHNESSGKKGSAGGKHSSSASAKPRKRVVVDDDDEDEDQFLMSDAPRSVSNSSSAHMKSGGSAATATVRARPTSKRIILDDDDEEVVEHSSTAASSAKKPTASAAAGTGAADRKAAGIVVLAPQMIRVKAEYVEEEAGSAQDSSENDSDSDSSSGSST